jgi:hypothetical protein
MKNNGHKMFNNNKGDDDHHNNDDWGGDQLPSMMSQGNSWMTIMIG